MCDVPGQINTVREYVQSGCYSAHLLSAEYNTGNRLTQPAQYTDYTPLLIITMVSISLQPESGYVFLVVAGTFVLNFYQMIKVNIG